MADGSPDARTAPDGCARESRRGLPRDVGFAGLAALARLRGLHVDPRDLRHRAGNPASPPDARELARVGQEVGLKLRLRRVSRRRLGRAALPALAVLSDGGTVLLARADAGRVLLYDAAANRPVERTRAEFDAAWSGRLLVAGAVPAAVPGAEPRPAAAGGFGLRWFLPALGRHGALLAEVVCASLFLQIFGLATPLFSMVVIDKVLSSGTVGTLDVLVIGLALMAVFEAVMGGLRGLLLSHTTSRVDVELGARLFDHLASLPLAWFESRPVGALVARIRELESVRAFLTGPGLTILLDLLFTVVFLAVMWRFSPALTGIVLLTVVGYGLVHLGLAPLLRARLQDRFARGADTQSFLVEAVGAMETLKAVAAEPRLRRHWHDLLAASSRASLRAAIVSDATSQASGFLSKAMAVGVLWYGAHLVMDGMLTAGGLIAFNMLAGRVSQPVMRLAQLWQQVQQARVAVQKLGEVLNAQPEPGAAPGRMPLGTIEGRVDLRDVTFRYRPGGPAVLEGLSLSIPAGQVLGIVGVSGSGKSTLARLVQRLHVPERGVVAVDGADLAGADPAWLRRQIGVVPQEVTLFNRSVRENLALTDPGLPAERIVEAAKLAGAHDFILALPDGYDTVIGERGMRLSGGQRQRLALARALVTDPRILILDEATSSLDYESEAIVHRNMRRICAGRTVIVIAHRLAALREADRIVVLEHGAVVEDGTHAELAAAAGRYARLHAFQLGTAGHHGAPMPSTQGAAARVSAE